MHGVAPFFLAWFHALELSDSLLRIVTGTSAPLKPTSAAAAALTATSNTAARPSAAGGRVDGAPGGGNAGEACDLTLDLSGDLLAAETPPPLLPPPVSASRPSAHQPPPLRESQPPAQRALLSGPKSGASFSGIAGAAPSVEPPAPADSAAAYTIIIPETLLPPASPTSSPPQAQPADLSGGPRTASAGAAGAGRSTLSPPESPSGLTAGSTSPGGRTAHTTGAGVSLMHPFDVDAAALPRRPGLFAGCVFALAGGIERASGWADLLEACGAKVLLARRVAPIVGEGSGGTWEGHMYAGLKWLDDAYDAMPIRTEGNQGVSTKADRAFVNEILGKVDSINDVRLPKQLPNTSFRHIHAGIGVG